MPCSSASPRSTTGSTALGILSAAAEGRVDLLVLLGADPIADCPDADLARRAIAGARRIIAVDTFLTESSGAADVVLAAAAYGEKSGTTTNLEGRVTEVGQKITAAGTSRPDWMIASELAELLGLDDVADDARVGRGDHRRRRRGTCRRTPPSPGSPCARAGTACSPCRPPTRRRSPSRCRAHPTGSATTTGWC